MMNNQPKNLQIGDEIGFVRLAQNVDDKNSVVFFPVVEITERDGERAYRYQYPDGQISKVGIKESMLSSHTVKIHRIEVISPQNANLPNLAICLTDRKTEFVEALKRATGNDFDVFHGWDRDTFFVVNRTNKSEYRIEFETVDGKVYAQCECPDFIYRKRCCKHLAVALQETFFGIGLAV